MSNEEIKNINPTNNSNDGILYIKNNKHSLKDYDVKTRIRHKWRNTTNELEGGLDGENIKEYIQKNKKINETRIGDIRKKGPKDKCVNYRLISVTSTMSPLYGNIVKNIIEKDQTAGRFLSW